MALQVVLYECAQDDHVVLMGGGGQWLLRGVPHALRVRIVAPFPERVTRLTATLSAQGKERVTPKIVAQFIRRDDIQKSARMRYLFDVDLKDPGLYDVHINTAILSRGAAVDIVKTRVLEVDVEEIAHPGRLLKVIPANELGDDLRRDAFLPLGRQCGGQPRHALGKGSDDSHPKRVGHATEQPLPTTAHQHDMIVLRKLVQDHLESHDAPASLRIKPLDPRRPVLHKASEAIFRQPVALRSAEEFLI